MGILHDVRFALRSCRRRPLLTGVVVLTLALGISATSVVFTVVDAVLLEPLPFAEPERLTVVRAGLPGQQQAVAQLAGPEILDVLARTRTLVSGGAIWVRPGVLRRSGAAASEIEVGWMTPGFLETLRVPPVLGRLPSTDEHRRNDVIVLGYELWQQDFGGDPGIVGRRLMFDDEPRTVVGVMPRGFRMYFPPEDGVPPTVRAWLPWGGDIGQLTRTFRVFTMVGRVDQAVGWPALQAELEAIAAGIAREHVHYGRSGFALKAEPLAEAFIAPVRPTLLVLAGVVVIVLVVASANVANLLLIGQNERATEFAVRLALGAGTGRLVRQLVAESVLLGIAGAVAGVQLAVAAVTLLATLDPDGLPRAAEVSVGGRTLLAAGGAALFAALTFGSIAARRALVNGRRACSRGPARGSAASSSTSRTLVVVQVALSAVLLCGTGVLGRSLVKLNAIDPGFDPSGVLSVRLSLPDVRYPYSTSGPAIAEFYRQLDDSLATLSGVRAAGATLSPPLSEAPMRARPYAYRHAGGEIEWGAMAADYRTVTPGWFHAVGARLVSGRFLDERDRWDRPIAVVVDTSLAQKAWPGRNPLGQAIRVELFREGSFRPHWGEVAGVIEPIRLSSLVRPGREQVYVAHHQSPQRTMYPAVRSAGGDPLALVPAVQEAVRAIEPELPVFDVRPASAYVDDAMAQTRFALIGLAIIGGVALLLATCGVFAALASSVGTRRREIGIRLALGASPAAVFASTLGQGFRLAAVGVVAGIAAAAASSQVLASLVYGVSVTDRPTFAAVAVALAGVALLACSLPAAFAARVDPADTLRLE